MAVKIIDTSDVREEEAPPPEEKSGGPVRGTIVYNRSPAEQHLWAAGERAYRQQDDTLDALAKTGSAINDGLATGVGGIVDLVNSGMQAASDIGNAGLETVGLPPVLPDMSERPFAGSDMLRAGISTVAPRLEAESATGRIAQRAVQESAAAIPGVVFGAGLQKAAQAGKYLTPRFKYFADVLADMSPAKLLQLETLAAAPGGVGAGIAAEAGGGPWAQFAGQLVGTFGAAGAAGIMRKAREWRRAQLNVPTADEMKRYIGGLIAEQLESDDDLATALQERNYIRQGISVDDGVTRVTPMPDYDPSTAAATGSPGLIKMERSMRSGPGMFEQNFLHQRAKSHDAIRQGMRSVNGIPATGEGIAAVRQTVQTAMDNAARAVNEAQEALTRRNAQSGSAMIDPQNRPRDAALGQSRREMLEEVKDTFEAEMGRLYGTINPRVRLPMRRIVRAARRANRRGLGVKGEHLDPEFQRIIDDFNRKMQARTERAVRANPDLQGADEATVDAYRRSIRGTLEEQVQVSYGVLMRLRSSLLESRGIARASGNKQLSRRLGQVFDAVQSTMDDLAHSERYPDQARQYATANAFAREGYSRLENKTRAAKVLETRERGGYVIDDARVGEQFVRQGREGEQAAIDDVRSAVRLEPDEAVDADGNPTGAPATFVEDPAALRTTFDFALNDAARAAYDERTGVVSAERLAAWRRNHAELLRQRPDIDQATRTMERAQEALEAAHRGAVRDMEELERSAAATLLNADPGVVVERVLGEGRVDQAAMRRFNTLLRRNPEAWRGWKRAILDHIENAITSKGKEPVMGGNRSLVSEKLTQMLEKYNTALSDVFTREEMATLRQFRTALNTTERSVKMALHVGSDTASLVRNAPRRPTAQMISAGQLARYGMGRFVGHGATVVVDKALEMFRGKLDDIADREWQALLEEALLNPEVAQDWIQLFRGQRPAQVLNRFHSHLLTMGYDIDDDDENGDYDPKRDDVELSEEEVSQPSPAYDDGADIDMPAETRFIPPVDKNEPQIRGAQTKRIAAAKRVVKTARSASMNPPKVAREMRQKGLSVADIQKKSEASRRKPFEDLVERNSGDLQRLLAVVEALKSDERELVRDLAKPAIDKLIEAERDDLTAAEAMARADELFAPPLAEEGASAAV